MRREYAPVTGRPANFNERAAALLRISRIPTAGPQPVDQAVDAGSGAQERIALPGAEPERLLNDFHATRRTDPGGRPSHFDERPHLGIDQSVVSRSCMQCLISLDSSRVKRPEVNRGQLLQNLDFAACALRCGQSARQLESMPQKSRSFARGITLSCSFGLELQVLDGASPIRAFFEVMGKLGGRLIQVPQKQRLQPLPNMLVELCPVCRCQPPI